MPFSAGVFRQLLACTSLSISLLVVGTALGWPSPVILAMEKTGEPFNMTHDDIAIMVSVVYLGNMISPIPTGIIMDTIGRKNTLDYITLFPIFSWMLVYFAKSATVLYIARFLIGLYIGAVRTIVPMYIAEVSEPNVRGAFSTIFLFMANLGSLVVFLAGSFINYYNLAIVLGIIPIILAAILTFIPESPYWYVKRGRHEDAVRALSWLRCYRLEIVKEELSRIESAVTSELRSGRSYKDLLRTRGNRKALFIVLVLSVAQGASGISAIIAYTSTTLPSGLGSLTPNDCVTVMGIVMTCSIILSTFLVDKSGRRPLLTISSIGCCLAMFSAGTWFFMDTNTDWDVKAYSWIPFASFLAYSVLFSIGLGPLASTIQGEMFPTNTKALASGITTICLAATSCSMNMVYQRIADDWGMYVNFWIFAVSSFAAALVSITLLVETKGKTLQEIQRELNKDPHSGQLSTI